MWAGSEAVKGGTPAPLHPQWLAAGRQDLRPRCTSEDPDRQGSSRFYDMLAVVEHEQHVLIAQPSDHAGKRAFGVDFEAEHGSQRARHEARIVERRQIDQPGATLVVHEQRLGHGQSNRGLADSRPVRRSSENAGAATVPRAC